MPFIASARNLRLDGSKLRCELQHNGGWVPAEADLNSYFGSNGFGKVVYGAPGGFWGLLDHSKTRLDGQTFYGAIAAGKSYHNVYYDFTLDLDRFFKNKDGQLVWMRG